MTLTIPLLSRYVSGVSRIVARVELGRQDGWKSIGSGEGKELSVLTAFIKGNVRPRGIRSVFSFSLRTMMCSLVSCRGIISRYPVLSGVVASGVFLAVSFTILAICLIPSLGWRYDDKGPATTKAGPSVRPRAVSDVLIDRRARKRSLKRSGSIGSVKREV